ncbi:MULTISPECIES: hypothetical protein [Streptomyces]|uniref:Uncharacterized protein n=1 Tax=Streptomyces lichenis TaxID=2306967 RepID=A0ABT0IBQ3_9ACTN|nr:hypothetical protein [Streptomyces lichenis]MCK8678735.1 hypothetical protein [Streptomyces lichenis]
MTENSAHRAATAPAQSETGGLVLLINSALGGVGTVYVTTDSTAVTVVSAVLVLLITVVVLAVRRTAGAGDGTDRKDERGGR